MPGERFGLDNEIDLLILQNAKLINSSVYVLADAGAVYDRDDAPGLAHLTEHMVFQGSDKYPGQNDCIEFIKNNNGEYNGFITKHSMEFYIRINSNTFAKACDILAHALGKPILNGA
jgi:insulysin